MRNTITSQRNCGVTLIIIALLLNLSIWRSQGVSFGQVKEPVTIITNYGIGAEEFYQWIPGDVSSTNLFGLVNLGTGRSGLTPNMKGSVGSVFTIAAMEGARRTNTLRAHHIAKFTGLAHVRISVETTITSRRGGLGLPYWEVNNLADLHGNTQSRQARNYIPVYEASQLLTLVPITQAVTTLERSLATMVATMTDVKRILQAMEVVQFLKDKFGFKDVYTDVFEQDMVLTKGADYYFGGGHEVKVACSGTIAQHLEAISFIQVEITEKGSRAPEWVRVINVTPKSIEIAWQQYEIKDFYGYVVKYREQGKSAWENHLTSEGSVISRERTRHNRVVTDLKPSTSYEFRVITLYNDKSDPGGLNIGVSSPVAKAKTAALALPDLIINSLSFDSPPVVGKPVSIQAVIVNTGTTPAAGVGYGSYDVYVDGKRIASPRAGPGQGPLQPGRTWRTSVLYTFTASGPHIIRWVVDPENRVTEQSETNNEKTLQLSLAHP